MEISKLWNKTKMLASLLQVLPTWPLCRERDEYCWQLFIEMMVIHSGFFGHCRVGLYPVWLYPLIGTFGTLEWILTLALRYMKGIKNVEELYLLKPWTLYYPWYIHLVQYELYIAYKNNIAAVTQLVLVFWYRSISTPINNFKNNSVSESKYRFKNYLTVKGWFFGKEVFDYIYRRRMLP